MVGPGLRSEGLIDARLTEAQEGLWLSRRLDPANPSQNTGQILRFVGSIDTGVLRSVVRGVLDECDAFSTRILDGPTGPRVTSEGAAQIETTVVDLSDGPRPERTARGLIQRDIERPRDPAADPMVTSVLYRVGPDAVWWYLCAQHLVVDGYGTTLLNTRVLDVLAVACGAERSRTKPFPSFRAVVDEDAGYRASDTRQADRAFWLGEVSDLPAVRSLKDGEPLAAPFHHRARAVVPTELFERMKAMAKGAGVGWPDVVLAGTAAYVSRHIGSSDAVIGVPTMNRLGSASARVPCSVMNVVPLRAEVREDEAPESLVRRVGEAGRRARPHNRYRSEELRRDIGAVGGGRRLFGPLVNVLPFQPLPPVPGVEVELEVLGAGPVDDLTITFRGGGVGADIALEVDANPTLYGVRETEAHRDRLLAFLRGFLEAEGPLRDVPTLTEAETERWVHAVNDTERPVAPGTLVSYIERRLEAAPEATALVGDGIEVSAGDFLERVRSAARCLRAAGVGAEGAGADSRVAVLLPRSVDQVVAFFGAVWAGAAYLPLDPDHPDARLDDLIRSAGPVVIVTDAANRGRVEGAGVRIVESTELQEVRAAPTAVVSPSPADPAYTIFTSGSTGRPKGVVVEHRAIVNRLEWMRERFEIGAGDVVLYKTPATFDVSVWELFLPALSGATLVVAPEGLHRDPGGLARLVRERAVTAMHFVPSMLGPFLAHPESEGLEIPRVFCSGEALTPALRDRFHERVDGRLHNLYGPTEAAVDVSHQPCPPTDRSDPIPIGRPVWNTRLYVLDAHLRPLPDGVPGELYIGGVQLARGYLDQEEMTRERFVPDPFVPGERMYRTGDLASWRGDGAVLFGGRIDHQVKVRGQRIELGEIEAALQEVDGVRDAVVVLRDDGASPALVGYVVLRDPDADVGAIRTGLGQRLPEAMVPTAIVALGELPRTTSGKVDRRALPAPPSVATRDREPLRTDAERTVADLFRSVLDLSEVPGPSDDFFDLGGHSLSAIEVLAGIRDRTGLDLGPGVLFSRPTVARLARALDDASAAGSGALDVEALEEAEGLAPVLVLSAGPPDGPPPLYCVHPAGGLSWCYAALARELNPPRRVVALQAHGLSEADRIPASLDRMAEVYVDEVLAVHTGGPIHLLGWSTGGTIAQVMAARLRTLGIEPGILALLDAYPADRFRAKSTPRAFAAYEALLLIAGLDPKSMDPAELTRDRVRALLAETGHVLGSLSERALDGVVRVVDSNNALVRAHQHTSMEGELIHFRAGLDHAGKDLDASMWAPYADVVEPHVVPALHARMTAMPTVARIATVLDRKMADRESTR